jgi:hypothetical protein
MTLEFGNQFEIRPSLQRDGKVRIEFEAELTRLIESKNPKLPPRRGEIALV